jgi:hypothetical protein
MAGSMATSRQRGAGLRPGKFRIALVGREARLRLGRRQWRRLFLEGLLDEGTDAACRAAGVNLGHALATRARERRFRAAWDAATAERRTGAEARLVDGLIAMLQPGADSKPKVPDKAALAAWREVHDERRRIAVAAGERGGAREPAAPRARSGAGQVPGDGGGQEPLPRAAACEQERLANAQVEALIAQVAAGIAAAEARLGLAPAEGRQPEG